MCLPILFLKKLKTRTEQNENYTKVSKIHNILLKFSSVEERIS